MKAPGAGQLRHRIAVEKQVKVADNCGGFEMVWQAQGSLWCDKQDANVGFSMNHGVPEYTQGIKFLCRKAPVYGMVSFNVDAYRIVYRGEIYKVVGFAPIDSKFDFYAISCTKWGAVPA